MRTVKEPSRIMLDVPCRCGGYAQHRIGNVEHHIGSKKITVKNVPHYYCKDCQKYSYGTDASVSSLLKDAFRKNLSEIEYK